MINDAEWSTKNAMRAIIALGGVDNPSEYSIAALWTAVQTPAYNKEREILVSTATLALGSLGENLQISDLSEYDLLRSQLLSGATVGTGSEAFSEQRASFIHAIGNTGDSSFASDIVTFLNDDAPLVRQATASSLSKLGADQASTQLVSSYKNEKNRRVRSAITESFSSLTEPSPALNSTIRSDIKTEYDETTRLRMAQFLGINLDSFPENKAVLQEILRTEQSKRIRQEIANTLAIHNRSSTHSSGF